MQAMSRDAYKEISGRAKQEARAEDTTAWMQEVERIRRQSRGSPKRRSHRRYDYKEVIGRVESGTETETPTVGALCDVRNKLSNTGCNVCRGRMGKDCS